MAKHGVGGTKFSGRKTGGIIDAPQHVLAQLAQQPPPAVLSNLPKYPPGDPRNAALAKLVVELPDLVDGLAADPEKIGRNAARLAKKKEPARKPRKASKAS